jgi:hypothetical protein
MTLAQWIDEIVAIAGAAIAAAYPTTDSRAIIGLQESVGQASLELIYVAHGDRMHDGRLKARINSGGCIGRAS